MFQDTTQRPVIVIPSENPSSSKKFHTKPMIGWMVKDIYDWRDSLFMREHKSTFV